MPTKKHKAPWSGADLRTMRACAKAGWSARGCARTLGRTRGAVAFKAMTEGVRFHAIKQPPGVQRRRKQREKLARLRVRRARLAARMNRRAQPVVFASRSA